MITLGMIIAAISGALFAYGTYSAMKSYKKHGQNSKPEDWNNRFWEEMPAEDKRLIDICLLCWALGLVFFIFAFFV